MKYLLVLVFLYFVCITAKDGKETKEKDGRKPSGKKIAMRQSGDIDITIRSVSVSSRPHQSPLHLGILFSRRKWSSEKQSRTLCCPLAGKHCKYPCKGLSCEYHLSANLTQLTRTIEVPRSVLCPAVSSLSSPAPRSPVAQPTPSSAWPPAPAPPAGRCRAPSVSRCSLVPPAGCSHSSSVLPRGGAWPRWRVRRSTTWSRDWSEPQTQPG